MTGPRAGTLWAGTLWDWALAAYARPGAADACLELQDRHRQNVPLLLWTLWSAEARLNPDLRAGAAVARAWDGAAVSPLRALRRDLKSPRPELGDADREAVRARIKAAELEAERRLLLALADLPASMGAVPRAGDLLTQAAGAWGAPVPPATFDALLRNLNVQPA